MRTFKQHQIDGKIIEQAIQEAILPDTISGSKSYRSIVNMYLKS
jgi:hypothetical protein